MRQMPRTENRSQKQDFLSKRCLAFCKIFANSLRSDIAKNLSKKLRHRLRKSVFAPTIFSCEAFATYYKIIIMLSIMHL
jgi:hypothetical protein